MLTNLSVRNPIHAKMLLMHWFLCIKQINRNVYWTILQVTVSQMPTRVQDNRKSIINVKEYSRQMAYVCIQTTSVVLKVGTIDRIFCIRRVHLYALVHHLSY
jgi:hypothetical protein